MNILAARGVYCGERQEGRGLRQIEKPEIHKTLSPVAQYALAAVRDLGINLLPETGLVSLCGATGCLVDRFDRAWQKSRDGQLTGTDFASRRYRRIHPFTLISSLQNQIAASLSMELGLQGPAMNAIASDNGVAYLLPTIAAMLERCPLVLLVLASAGNRGEEAVKLEALQQNADRCEGAVAFAFGKEQGHGRLLPLDEGAEVASSMLATGFALVEAVHAAEIKHFRRIDGEHRGGLVYRPN